MQDDKKTSMHNELTRFFFGRYFFFFSTFFILFAMRTLSDTSLLSRLKNAALT